MASTTRQNRTGTANAGERKAGRERDALKKTYRNTKPRTLECCTGCHLVGGHFEPGEEAPELFLTLDKLKKKKKKEEISCWRRRQCHEGLTEGTRWRWGSKSKALASTGEGGGEGQ